MGLNRLKGEIAQDHFKGEQRSGDRRVERGGDARRRAAAHEGAHAMHVYPGQLPESGSQGGADLGNGSFPAHRETVANTYGGGHGGFHGDAGFYAAAAQRDGFDDVRQSTGLAGAEVNQDTDDKPAGRGDADDEQRISGRDFRYGAAPGKGFNGIDQPAEGNGSTAAEHAYERRGADHENLIGRPHAFYIGMQTLLEAPDHHAPQTKYPQPRQIHRGRIPPSTCQLP